MKCCICGTVRNCGKYLDNIFSIMEQFGNLLPLKPGLLLQMFRNISKFKQINF